MNKSILYQHASIRTYRKSVFQSLADKGVEFLFTSSHSSYRHMSQEYKEALSQFKAKYTIGRELKFLGVDGLCKELIQCFKYDIIIFSIYVSAPFLLLAPLLKLFGKKIIVFDELWCYPIGKTKYKWIQPYARFLLRRCVDATVVAGSAAKSMRINQYKMNPNKVFVAYNNTIDMQRLKVNEEKLQNIKNKIESFSQGRKVILYLGRIVKCKGLDKLIEAIKNIDDACLLVVGDGDFKPHCQQLAEQLNQESKIMFWGGCLFNESIYFYKSVDIFALPARFLMNEAVNCEAWGFTINEAMSCELPVVTTNAVGAAYDLIIDKETGMLAQEDSSKDLAEKIAYLVNNPKEAKEIGKNARIHLLNTCSNEQNVQAYLDAIEYATNN